MRRRHLPLLLAAGTPAAALAQPAASPAVLDATVAEAVRSFAALPGETALLVAASGPKGPLTVTHREEAPIFVGSCIKTLILGAWLLEVEAGRLSLAEPLAVDDGLRSLVSPVLGQLTGRATAQVVLEAMIAHSDNTATDIALHRVGADKVRALIARMGLAGTRIPDSTRIMFSILAGAPPGSDLGWKGINRAVQGQPPGPLRAPANPDQTMVSTARDLCSWYARALGGEVFATPAALAEFRRISAMADAMPLVAPPDVMAYGKGGSIDWNGAQAVAVAGQMVAGPVRAAFFAGANWPGEVDSAPGVIARLGGALRTVLTRAATDLA